MDATSRGSFPPGIGFQDIKRCGTSGMAALDPKTKRILKFPLGDDDECARCDHERDVYQALESSKYPRPSSVLKYYGTTEHGILLEYAELGPIRKFALERGSSVSTDLLLRWARQAAEALQFLHANGVSHGDFNCTNFFLNNGMNLKVGDFTSSCDLSPESIEEDISSFGSAIYEMATGHLPYATLSEDDREVEFKAKRFPDLAGVQMGSLIHKCWNDEFTTCVEVLQHIKDTCQKAA